MKKEKKPPLLMVVYGNDPVHMTELLLSAAKMGASIPAGSSIALKPNLVVPRPSSEGGTTTPEIVEAIIKHLHFYGHRNISIMESSWTASSTRRAFQVCGYERIGKTYNVPLINLEDDQVVSVKQGNDVYQVCKSAYETDVLINVPVLKGHCQTHMTGALKNLKGCIPDSEKRRYHTLGLHKPIAEINAVLRPEWTVMDALCGDLGFENGGNPSTMHRMMISSDPVLLDSYSCTLLGIPVDQVEYITRAAAMGIGELYQEGREPVLLELNNPESSYRTPQFKRPIFSMTDQRDACSACFASLVKAVLDLDEHSFSSLEKLFQKNKNPLFAIGQGFASDKQNSEGAIIGVGSCTKNCTCTVHIQGCPPNPQQIHKAIGSVFGK